MPSTPTWKRMNGRLVRVESILDCPAVVDYLASIRPSLSADALGAFLARDPDFVCEGCGKEMTAAEVDAIPPSVFDSDCLTCLGCVKKEMEAAMEFASFDFDAFVPKRKPEEEDEEDEEYECSCMECGAVIKGMTEEEYTADDELKQCEGCRDEDRFLDALDAVWKTMPVEGELNEDGIDLRDVPYLALSEALGKVATPTEMDELGDWGDAPMSFYVMKRLADKYGLEYPKNPPSPPGR